MTLKVDEFIIQRMDLFLYKVEFWWFLYLTGFTERREMG